MEKLRGMIEKWLDGKIPRNMRLYLVDVMIMIYNDLAAGRTSEFISEDALPILRKCGIKTAEKGIGWVAMPE